MKSHLQCINAAWGWLALVSPGREKPGEQSHGKWWGVCVWWGVSPGTPAAKKQLCFKRTIKIMSMSPHPPGGLSSIQPKGDLEQTSCWGEGCVGPLACLKSCIFANLFSAWNAASNPSPWQNAIYLPNGPRSCFVSTCSVL
jgi:hypothetical protein